MEIKDWEEVWLNELNKRKKLDPDSVCTFGIKPLDDALIGVLKNDLVVIGADSGVGKSDIVLNMALHNARCGKKVALYFIEGGAEEAITRIKWKLMRERYYKTYPYHLDMDYRKWRMNLVDTARMNDLEVECLLELKKEIKNNLEICHFEGSFTVNDLTNSLGWFMKQEINSTGDFLIDKIDVDLIIIDHLQYFSLTDPKQEFVEMTQILIKVKEITSMYNIPVILVSHLRKKDKDRGLPSQEDFFGTSNIAKVASVAITVAPNYQFDDYNSEVYPTFFRIVKSRTGIRSNIAMLCPYDFKKGDYEKEYVMYKLLGDKPNSTALEPLKYPKWATKPKIETGRLRNDIDQ